MKVIQVGIGGMGATWLGAVQRSPQVEFAGFVEIDEKIAREQAAAFHLNPSLIFQSLPAALENVEADAVINVTPPEAHREICVGALEAGLPVLTEKPLAGNLEDAKAIVAAAEATGVLCSVAQNYRYRPLTQTIKASPRQRRIGRCRGCSLRILPRSAFRRLPRGDAPAIDHRHVDPPLRFDALLPRQ